MKDKIFIDGVEYKYRSWMDGMSEEEIKSTMKWVVLVAYLRWFPDKFYDIITPKKGGIKLTMYQRVMLRAFARFTNAYFVLPRGSAKTHNNVLGEVHESIFYPNLDVSLTAKTKEQGAKILKDKFINEILRQYPALKNELGNSVSNGKPYSFSREQAEIYFKNGSKIDMLGNAQSSKGLRRHRLRIEESALLNNELYEDVLQPIPKTTTRRTAGKSLINEEENHGSIHFFTTSTFRGCDEHKRLNKMLREMAECKDSFVFTGDYRLPVMYGLLSEKSVEDARENSSYINFAMNYLSEWVGAAEDALIDMQLLMEAQTISHASLKPNPKHEYILAVDVAKSNDSKNNKTVIEVIGFDRKKDNTIRNIYVEMMIVPKNGLTFEAQALEIKRIASTYKPNAVVIDAQSYGQGLIEELVKDTTDPITNKKTEKWCTIQNDTGYSRNDISGSIPMIYALKATSGNQTKIIVNFTSQFMSRNVRLLCDSNDINIPKEYQKDSKKIFMIEQAHLNTSILIEEIANLKMVQKSTGKIEIDRVTKKVDKDRFSALAYGLYYLNYEENRSNNNQDGLDCVFY